VTGRGRPETKIIGRVVEVKLPGDVLDALDAEADELGWKRAALARWIIAERYEQNVAEERRVGRSPSASYESRATDRRYNESENDDGGTAGA
jgi:hypothetical protein